MTEKTYAQKLEEVVRSFPEVKGRVLEKEKEHGGNGTGYLLPLDIQFFRTKDYRGVVYNEGESFRDYNGSSTNRNLRVLFRPNSLEESPRTLDVEYWKQFYNNGGYMDEDDADPDIDSSCKELVLNPQSNSEVRIDITNSQGKVAKRFLARLSKSKIEELSLRDDPEWIIDQIKRENIQPSTEPYVTRAGNFMQVYPISTFPKSYARLLQALKNSKVRYPDRWKGETNMTPLFDTAVDAMLENKTQEMFLKYDERLRPEMFDALFGKLTGYDATVHYEFSRDGEKNPCLEGFNSIVREIDSEDATRYFKGAKKPKEKMEHVMFAALNWTHITGYDFKKWLEDLK